MEIHIASGVGKGPTTLAAFDSALYDAGIANYNLLCLSSVIPTGSNITVYPERVPEIQGRWGDRLYVVMAHMRTAQPNQEAWGGIGWVQDETTKRGLFVEHEGYSEESVRQDITDSLGALMLTRNIDFGPINMEVRGTICEDQPACALVAAVYESSGWETAGI
ncbi:MAG TPA: pyruvoyl-dependent arginine decarboxylase [Candidatus Saccharimonadales bacterium]|nr:pyruvoyl-dependent arginine decarboxylase [Candidatus Saccharimonadales bacterium]